MKLMLELPPPSSGQILLGAEPILRNRSWLVAIGSLIEGPSVYLHLGGREHLQVFATYHSLTEARFRIGGVSR